MWFIDIHLFSGYTLSMLQRESPFQWKVFILQISVTQWTFLEQYNILETTSSSSTMPNNFSQCPHIHCEKMSSLKLLFASRETGCFGITGRDIARHITRQSSPTLFQVDSMRSKLWRDINSVFKPLYYRINIPWCLCKRPRLICPGPERDQLASNILGKLSFWRSQI